MGGEEGGERGVKERRAGRARRKGRSALNSLARSQGARHTFSVVRSLRSVLENALLQVAAGSSSTVRFAVADHRRFHPRRRRQPQRRRGRSMSSRRLGSKKRGQRGATRAGLTTSLTLRMAHAKWHVLVLAHGGALDSSVTDLRGSQATLVRGIHRRTLSLAHKVSGCSHCADWFEVKEAKPGPATKERALAPQPLGDNGRSNAFTGRTTWTASCARHAGAPLVGAAIYKCKQKTRCWSELVCEAREATHDDPNHLFWPRCLFDQAVPPPRQLQAALVVAAVGARRMGRCGMQGRNHPGGFVRNTLRAHPAASLWGGLRGDVCGTASLQGSHRPPQHRPRLTQGKEGVRGSELPGFRFVENVVVATRGPGQFESWSSRNPLGLPHTARVWNTRLRETGGPTGLPISAGKCTTSAQKPSKQQAQGGALSSRCQSRWRTPRS